MGASDIVIVGAARTPIGKFGGGLSSVHAAQLGAWATQAALERARVSPGSVDEVVMGHGRQAGSGPNPARQVVRRAGLADQVPAQTINKACASGMQAIVTAAQSLLLGEYDIVVAGGIESMSRMPYMIDPEDARWGHRMGHFPLVDAMYRDGFSCPLANLIMGQTAEVLARQYGISREESDRFALSSQQKAARAMKEGRLADEIVPVDVADRRGGTTRLSVDEHPRAGATLESLARLPLAFDAVDGQPGIITAGSSSGVTDGGAALVLTRAGHAESLGLTPLARIVGWATAAVDPRIMGIGPVPAVRRLLDKTGLTLERFDLVELNEAFAPQVLACLRDLPIAEDRLNVNGGAIALGHPIGCTGARIVVTLVYEMLRRRARLGLATLCVSGGMGMALALESV